MPIANSYVPPPAPFTGPVTKTPVDVQPGVATSTTKNAPTPVNTVDNTPPITPGVATSTEPNTPPPPPTIIDLEISSVDLGLSTLNTTTGNTNIYYASVAAGNITEIQFNKGNSEFGAVSNLTFTTNSGLVSVGSIRGRRDTYREMVGNSAFTAKWANYYLGTQWPVLNTGTQWLDGDNNASASFVLIDNEERVKYQETSLQFTYEAHPLVTFRPDQFLTSVRMENRPVTRNVWANVANASSGVNDRNKVIAFCDDISIRNPMAIFSGQPYGNETVTTNPALWPSWFRLPCAEEQLEAENDQPLYQSYNPAFAYVYGALPQVQGGGLQIYHPRRDSMVHITGNTIIGVNNVYHWASNAYWVSGNGASGPQGNLQGDLRLQGYGNGNVIISKNDYRDGWNPNNPANTWPGKYNYSNIYNYQTGVHNGEQNNLLIEYGNVIIQPVANVANNTLGIKFADGTFQYTAANGGGGGSSTIAVQEEGTNVVASANTINFVGSGVTASNVSGVATITIPGGITGVAVQEEGTNVLATANTINFVGSGVTASNVGNIATITITSGGISGIAVQEEGTNVLATANTINFVGSGVTASNVGGVATITIPGGSGNGTVAGNIYEVQFNNGNVQFGASPDYIYKNGGLFVVSPGANIPGTYGNTNANGFISASDELRVGVWGGAGDFVSDVWGRMRPEYPSSKTTPFYGFIGDPDINPSSLQGPGTIAITNEENEVNQAIVLMDALVYNDPRFPTATNEGTLFGISGLNYEPNLLAGNATTGYEAEWKQVLELTNKGNLKVGGSFVISPEFQFSATRPANNEVGIYFADGTFQYTAATGSGNGISGIDILYNASPVTANATAINFLGPLANVANVGFGNITDVTIGLTVQDESNVISGNASIGTLNFLGAGVTVTAGTSGVANITIPGSTAGNVSVLSSNITLNSTYVGGTILKWTDGDFTITAPSTANGAIPVGATINIFNASASGNANVFAGSGPFPDNPVLVGPRPNNEGILTYVQVGPFEQVTLVNLGQSAGNVESGKTMWFCYGSAYPLGVAYL
jgi:hypothetical protein